MTAALPNELVVISGLWGLFAAGISAYCAQVAGQMTYATLSDGRRQLRRLPLAFRLLLPLTPLCAPLVGAAGWRRARESVDRQLTAAGFDDVMRPVEFLGLRLLVPTIYGGLATAFVLLLFSASASAFLHSMRGPTSAIILLLAALYPALWLKSAIATRHRAIRRALPFLLDLLTLSVEAGLDFMTALQRHVERTEVDALGEELIRVVRAIQLGKPRREALRDMAWRVNFSDLRSVVNALVQADELGVSIGTILRIQSEQIRQRRFERAERLANEAPVKLLFPLLFCIFPAVFLILLAPVLWQVVRQGF
ncbi:MAG: type II secretion system F family protein [Lentisphaerae bacterium]|nr:type II secretion system F family protein [Lentisphaerota bacterium]